MYNSLRRWRGATRSADARNRQWPAEFHEGTRLDFLRRHECESALAAQGTRRQQAEFAGRLTRRVADTRNLRIALDHVADEGGTAPGLNGLVLGPLEPAERWELARALSEALRTGTYRPGPHRNVSIPKGPGRGTRTLRLLNAEDRVVQRAFVQILQPFVDPRFLPVSLGFRPGRDRAQALARALALAERNGYGVWVLDDIRDAFEQVPHGRLRDALRQLVPAEDLLDQIDGVIANQARRGLRQGGALSPLLLNVYLHHVLDRPWVRIQSGTPLIRVADDLLILARDRDEARGARSALEQRLRPAGFTLKGSEGTAIRWVDRGEPATWLGIQIRADGQRFQIQPTEASWYHLESALTTAHESPNAPLRAIEAIVGWIEQLGPCQLDPRMREIHARIRTLAQTFGFEEVPARSVLLARWRTAQARWLRLLSQARDAQDQDQPRTAAPPRPIDHRADPGSGLVIRRERT